MTNRKHPDAPESVLDQIEQDARHRRRARMLPDGPLSPDQINQVAKDLRQFRAEHRLSLKAVSRALGAGFSEPTLSQFETGNARGDMERLARGINEYIEREARKREGARPDGFVETEVARHMLGVFHLAVTSNGIGVITGCSGTGKTMVAKAAHATYTGSIYLRVCYGERRAPGLIHALANLVNVTRRSGVGVTQRLLIEQLRGSGRPIILDEAQQLTSGALDSLRDLHDEAGVPLILIGTKDVRKAVDDTDMFYGQFSSRVVASKDLTEIYNSSDGGGKPLFTVAEIRAIFERGQLRLTSDGADFLADVANIHGLGSLRLAAKLMDAVARMPRLRGKAIDARALNSVLRQMHGAAYQERAAVRQPTLRLRRKAG